ncbi:MAG: SIMPL domain-containing protein [Actinomycetota bacterium]|nr:SIMPL domain-containing protein [Actinomycetota bacterium]
METPTDLAPSDERRRGPRRRVEVVGTGRASATPDVVRLQLSLHTDAADVAAALRSTGALVAAIGEAAREQGVPATDIASTGAGVHPRHDRDGQRVVGYQAFHQLAIVVRDPARVGDLVEQVAARAGNALSVDAISLDLADTAALEVAARDAAFADARAKAGQYAALAGATLGGVLTVSEVGAGPAYPVAAGRAMAFRADSAMPVEAGSHTLTASVAVSFALDPGE